MNPRIAYQMSTERQQLPLLDSKPLIVQFVINVEYWPFEAKMPRALLPAPHGGQAVPDVPNFSWVDYGMRCGLPRFFEVLGDLPVTVAINASVLDAYPSAAAALRDSGWELAGHGAEQLTMHDVADQAAVVRYSLDHLEELTGRRPNGWLGPGLQESHSTPDVLAAEGVEYVFDWVVDDLPNWLVTNAGLLAALPYSLELNDSLLYAVQQQPSDELLKRVERTVETFADEIAEGASRVLTIPLHPHLMGVPHRIKALAEVVDLLRERDDTTFVDGRRMFDWFTTATSLSTSTEEDGASICRWTEGPDHGHVDK